MKRFVFTCGDINGIGPEIVIKSLQQLTYNDDIKLIYCCPKNVFTKSVGFLENKIKYKAVASIEEVANCKEKICVLDLGKAKIKYGEPTEISGQVAYESISKALDVLDANLADAIITAPISKLAFKMAGVDFPGHTELLGARYKTEDFKMMFLSEAMSCALVTIHEKLQDVPGLITEEKVEETIKTVMATLKMDFGIDNPRIALLGLNPHAGEEGKIGREEIDIIEPVVKRYPKTCAGPFVPDAFFGTRRYQNFNMVIGMYHDQVLIPFKLLNFDNGVNFTAGLPIIRTSPDHGTAYDIAGKGLARQDSMLEAVKWASVIIEGREKKI